MQPYELFIGLRYTRAKRRNHFISFISMISMLGIGLGVMALIVVLSVMNGFQKEIRARILGVTPHLQVMSDSGQLNDWQHVLGIVARDPEVRAAAPYVDGQGMVSLNESVQGVMVRGILPDAEQRLTGLGDKMKNGALGDLRAGSFNIVLGVDLARALGAHVGDTVLLITPQGQITPAGMLPRLKQFHVAGIFEIGMSPYDNALALINLEDAQKLYRMGNSVSGISGSLHNLDLAPQVAYKLEDKLPKDTYATDWTRQNANYFSVVAMEKRMMFIILSLIVLVAAFNIVSTLVMAVTDKQADIAILRTMGASPRSIMQIFMVQGMLIGLIGMATGVIGGVLIALNIGTIVPFIEQLFGVHFLSKEFYYISELPSDLQKADVFVVAGMSFLISLLATLYPSWRAAKIQPAEALRYE
ncbi:lipoprotein-releasing ABC transporter permease subunit [Sideroxydans lithotrophicus]|uniref:Lipoprotein releasing system, transmembrane protein, LolC/E family n=1 Tax=Sideroxydans lithotrophicus (strain ES-1) TaxID=580332 RepID=D5CRQ3_SIDLE|nr:lipoprotein-releasing ABC transporter permease subunit [Sideroxydans lithotrophicus]ADE11639.1 lipoprotein releasing system, transmembrane protein, LolC/E family [Sideroxydans lithotrophicus ES-1]